MKEVNKEDFEVTDEQLEIIKKVLTNSIKIPSANEILPNIYVGNHASALSKKFLISNNITYILNCGINLLNLFEKENNYKYLKIPLYDFEYQDLEDYVNKTNKFIEEGSSKGNKILIHCGEGVSRSVAICLMYMIIVQKYTFSEALKIMNQKRPCSKPNKGFIRQLKQQSMDIYNKI